MFNNNQNISSYYKVHVLYLSSQRWASGPWVPIRCRTHTCTGRLVGWQSRSRVYR